MYLSYEDQKLGSTFKLTDHVSWIDHQVGSQLIHLLWNRSTLPLKFTIDEIQITLKPNQITTITNLQKVQFLSDHTELHAFSFNREFYCLKDHDHEVSCNGILFYGTQSLPIISLDDTEVKSLNALLLVFLEEFETKDNIQGEMLQMLLKRLIIKCTRLAKSQLIPKELDNEKIDVIRKFNTLVEVHYREKKSVAAYADLLFKSPKTLSNLFSIYGSKTPLRIIQERIILEARRLLTYSDMTSKEISQELGFNDATTFTKMFRRIMEITPQHYKSSLQDKSEIIREV